MSAYEHDNSPIRDDESQPTRNMHRANRDVMAERTSETDDFDREHTRRVDAYRRIAAIVWTIAGFVEILVGLRILFKLLAANAGNGFVNFMYNLSGVFVNPFQGIVADVKSGGSVLEINSLISMLIFALLAWGVLKLVWLVLMVTEPTVS